MHTPTTELWHPLQARAGDRDGHVRRLRGVRRAGVQGGHARGRRHPLDQRPGDGPRRSQDPRQLHQEL